MGRGKLVERRKLLNAWRAPARPQVHQHRRALEVGQADLATVGIVEGAVECRLALVASVDTLDRTPPRPRAACHWSGGLRRLLSSRERDQWRINIRIKRMAGAASASGPNG